MASRVAVLVIACCCFALACRRGERNPRMASQIAEEAMRLNVQSAKTVREAWSKVHGMVAKILQQPPGTGRLAQMQKLSSIVALYGTSRTTARERAFSQELRFTMEQEIFDGLIRMNEMDIAWQGLLRSVAQYRTAAIDAKDNLEKINEKLSRFPNDLSLRKIKIEAKEGFLAMLNGYQCATNRIFSYILPNVKSRFGVSPDIERQVIGLLEVDDAVVNK